MNIASVASVIAALHSLLQTALAITTVLTQRDTPPTTEELDELQRRAHEARLYLEQAIHEAEARALPPTEP